MILTLHEIMNSRIKGPSEIGARHPRRNESVIARAAGMLKAAGDPERLRILELLLDGTRQVSDLAATMDAELSTTSQRLRLLLSEGLVVRERKGRAIFYSLSDSHVRDLIANVLEHAEPDHLGRL